MSVGTKDTGARALLLLSNLANALANRYDEKGCQSDLYWAITLNTEALARRPPGHEDRHLSLNSLAFTLHNRYNRMGSTNDLGRAINLYTEALAVSLPDHGHRIPMYANNLAAALIAQYERTRRHPDPDLERAIEMLAKALTYCPPGSKLRGVLLSSLGDACLARYEGTKSLSDLQLAVQMHSESLSLRPPGHGLRGVSLTNLASSLFILYCRTDSRNELKQAIGLHTEALELFPPGHRDRGKTLSNLGNALFERFESMKSMSDLERAIGLHDEGLKILHPGHTDRVASLFNLANALKTRYNQTGIQSDLDRSIKLYTEALTLCPPGHGNRGATLANLAGALSDRYDVMSTLNDLQQAIDFYAERLEACPLGHEQRPEALGGLANALRARFDRMGSQCDLERAIELHTEALAHCSPGHTYCGTCLDNLASTLRKEYDRKSSISDLERAIDLHTEALELSPPGHGNRLTSLSNLACALLGRYDRTTALCDLERAIELHSETTAACYAGHRDRCAFLSNLAKALCIRYDRMGALSDLKRGIKLFTEVLGLRPLGHRDRSMSLNNLAAALGDRYGRFGEDSDLRQIMDLCTEALSQCPPGHERRSVSLTTLANAFFNRHSRTSSIDDLEQAIKLHSEALDLRPRDHRERNTSLIGLATSLMTRYKMDTQKHSDLDWAIKLHTEALNLCKPGHRYRISALSRLANALISRYERTGDQNDLERGINLLKSALDICSREKRGEPIVNIAYPLRLRYERMGSLSDLLQVIALYTEALEFFPPGHKDRSLILNNLASALHSSSLRTDDQLALNKAIELLDEALALIPPSDQYRRTTLTSLGNALSSRHRKIGAPDDLARAVALYSEALSYCPPGHEARGITSNNLASALITYNNIMGNNNDFEKAIRLHREALELHRPGHSFRSHSIYLLSSTLWLNSASSKDEVFRLLEEGSNDLTSQLDASLNCALLRVRFAREAGDYTNVMDAYSSAIDLLRNQLPIWSTVHLQYDALCRRVGVLRIPMDAAAYAIEAGNIKTAVEFLDTGRSLIWSGLQRFREPLQQSELLDKKLLERFEAACVELQNITTTQALFDTSFDGITWNMIERETGAIGISVDILQPRKRERMEEYATLLSRIKQTKGLEGYLNRPSFEELKTAAVEGPVIIVNCSEYGSHVIIVFADRPPSLTHLDDSFRETALRLHDKLRKGACLSGPLDWLGRDLKEISKFLWDEVVESVVKTLKEEKVPEGSRIWWCPTSFLTRFPFHAAGNKKCSLVDFYVSSYTPTLKALINARKPSQSSSISHPEPDPSILVIGQTQDSSNLPSAKNELDVMRNLRFPVRCLDKEDATKGAVLEGLQSHSWAHFTCHGTLTALPFDISLVLYQGELTLDDIIKASLPDARFAFLAACHTAEQSPFGLDDESLHIAGAVHFCGFRSVVGTLWKMKDEDGPELARRFYEEMLGDEDLEVQKLRHTRAARALWKVTKEMKYGKKLAMDRWANFIHIGA